METQTKVNKSVKVKCNKCDEVITILIGDMSLEQVQEMMEKRDLGECPGHHVEFGKMADYWVIMPETLTDVAEEDMPSDEKWFAEIKESYGEGLWDSSQLTEEFTDIGFAWGFCTATRKSDGKSGSLNFGAAPISGKRYYFGFRA